MNWLDLALVLLVAGSVISGVRQGFSRAGFGFLAVVLAFLTAAWLYPANLKGFLIVFVVLICAGAVCAAVVGRVLRTAGMRWLDAVLGAAFGLTNALLFAVFIVVALMAFAPKFTRVQVARSQYVPYTIDAARAVAQVVPDEMKSRVEDSYVELMRVLPPKFRRQIPRLPHDEI